MKIRTYRRGFTLVELLVVITIILVLATLGFMGSSIFLKRAAAVKDVANMKGMWSAVSMYASDHAGVLPGPLFAGQRPEYNPSPGAGRLTTYIAEYLGYDNPEKDEPILPMVASWQKKDTRTPNYYFQRRIPTTVSNGSANIEPWGYPGASKPMNMSGAMSVIDSSRKWAFSDLDQLHPGAAGAGWINELPDHMSHGDYRLACYYDGHIGKLDKDNNPK